MERGLLNSSSPEDDDLEPLFTANRSRHRQAKNYVTGVFVAIVCIVVIASIIAAAGKLTGIHEQPSFVISITPIVNTSCGLVQGQQEDAVFVFRGIRYAAPPVNELRWQPPRPLEDANLCWTQGDAIYQAYNFQSSCYQYDPIAMRQGGSEDCLFVNVWTPQLERDAMLDVMLYIHGGGLMVGSGNIQGETPTPEISKTSNSVFVSFNYRLNVFGFLALEEFSESEKSPEGVSGNYGLRDQVQVLKWVRDNIRAFGGNPNSVTIFGPDGGSASVLALMSSPEATGLFHRAWAMSGLPQINTSLTQAQTDNRPFLKHSDCDHSNKALIVNCLYGRSAPDVMEAFQRHDHPNWDQNRDRDLPEYGDVAGGILVIDGIVIPLSPLDALRAERFNDVPLLVGSMAQAIDDRPQPQDLLMWTWDIYDEYLSHLDVFSPNLSTQAKRLYPRQMTPEYQLTSLVTDLRFTCPTNQMATMMATMMRSPVLRYIGTSRPSEPVKNEGVVKSYAFCGWDVLSFFGLAKHYVDRPSKQDRLFMQNLRTMLAALSPVGGATLRQYPEATYLVSEIITHVSKYNDEACQLWYANGLYPLAAWQM